MRGKKKSLVWNQSRWLGDLLFIKFMGVFFWICCCRILRKSWQADTALVSIRSKKSPQTRAGVGLGSVGSSLVLGASCQGRPFPTSTPQSVGRKHFLCSKTAAFWFHWMNCRKQWMAGQGRVCGKPLFPLTRSYPSTSFTWELWNGRAHSPSWKKELLSVILAQEWMWGSFQLMQDVWPAASSLRGILTSWWLHPAVRLS